MGLPVNILPGASRKNVRHAFLTFMHMALLFENITWHLFSNASILPFLFSYIYIGFSRIWYDYYFMYKIKIGGSEQTSSNLLSNCTKFNSYKYCVADVIFS